MKDSVVALYCCVAPNPLLHVFGCNVNEVVVRASKGRTIMNGVGEGERKGDRE